MRTCTWIALPTLIFTSFLACSASDNGANKVGNSGGSNSGGSSSGGSGAAASGGAGGTFVIDGGGATGGTGVNPDAACASSHYDGKQIPLDMFILFDQSGSMSADVGGVSLYTAIKNALVSFVQSPEATGIGVGLQYFPFEKNCSAPGPDCMCFLGICEFTGECNVNYYSTLDVPIALLPGVAPAIVTSLNNHGPTGGTPTHPAMQGIMQAALKHATANAGRKVIVVLATDGSPSGCSSTIQNVADVATAGAQNVPALQTFVIGLGNVTGLDMIAAAGGTNKALIVNTATANQDFLNAMKDIQGQALGCTYQIPTPTNGETINYSKVNVLFTPDGAGQDYIYGVGDASNCDPVLGGWYYDNPTNPKEIRMCPASCDKLSSTKGTIDIQLGCDTVQIPG